MNKNILEVKFTKINDDYSVGEIVHQDEEILVRGEFIDNELSIYSVTGVGFDNISKVLYIKGSYEDLDNPFIIKNEYIGELKQRISDLNTKYSNNGLWFPEPYGKYYYFEGFTDKIEYFSREDSQDDNMIKNYLAFPTEELATKGNYLSIIDRMQILYQYSRNCLFEPKNEQYYYKLDFDIISKKFVSVHVEGLKGIGVCWEKEEDLLNFIDENQKNLTKILNNFNNL